MVQANLIEASNDEGLIEKVERLLDEEMKKVEGMMNPTMTKTDVKRMLQNLKNRMPKPLVDTSEEVLKEWNSHSELLPSNIAVRMTKKRQQSLGQRWKDQHFRTNYKAAIERMKQSPFCMGNNYRKWRATFDWFLRPDTITKILEGQYDGNTEATRATTVSEHQQGF